jgi:hypothetical protein
MLSSRAAQDPHPVMGAFRAARDGHKYKADDNSGPLLYLHTWTMNYPLSATSYRLSIELKLPSRANNFL